jgi:hypothetical protein
MFTSSQQVWDAAVDRNTVVLRVIVAELVGLLVVFGGLDAVTVPRAIRNMILRVLRPAESAARRMIVIAARHVSVAGLSAKQESSQSVTRKSTSRTFTHSSPHLSSRVTFQLFDPRKRFGQRRITYTVSRPRVFFIAPDPPFIPLFQQPQSQPLLQPVADIQAGATRLCRRLKALLAALEDLPRQAKRLARLRALREVKKRHLSPLRIGPPPGHRKIPTDDVNHVLAECHAFAKAVLAEPNTS